MQNGVHKKNNVLVMTMIFLLLLIGNVNISESSGVTGHSDTQTQISLENTFDGTYFKEMLYLAKEELISRLGENYLEGTTAIEKSHIIFPLLFYKDLGLTFVFSAGKVERIEVCEETNIKGININDAKPGMNFEEIRYKLGEAEVNETWKATKAIKAYEIHYVVDGLQYKFMSGYKDGRASKLIISEDL
ncbi:MAG: hypothetical protein H6Q66_287 [Firmicutes bacterium]|nr:hypothetical protein [Bacillota bacterium]